MCPQDVHPSRFVRRAVVTAPMLTVCLVFLAIGQAGLAETVTRHQQAELEPATVVLAPRPWAESYRTDAGGRAGAIQAGLSTLAFEMAGGGEGSFAAFVGNQPWTGTLFRDGDSLSAVTVRDGLVLVLALDDTPRGRSFSIEAYKDDDLIEMRFSELRCLPTAHGSSGFELEFELDQVALNGLEVPEAEPYLGRTVSLSPADLAVLEPVALDPEGDDPGETVGFSWYGGLFSVLWRLLGAVLSSPVFYYALGLGVILGALYMLCRAAGVCSVPGDLRRGPAPRGRTVVGPQPGRVLA